MDSFTAGGGCDGGGSGGLGHTLYPDAAARSGGWGPTCNPFPAGAPRVPPPPALAAVMAEPEPHRNQDGRVRKPTSTSVLAVVPHAIGAATEAHMAECAREIRNDPKLRKTKMALAVQCEAYVRENGRWKSIHVDLLDPVAPGGAVSSALLFAGFPTPVRAILSSPSSVAGNPSRFTSSDFVSGCGGFTGASYPPAAQAAQLHEHGPRGAECERPGLDGPAQPELLRCSARACSQSAKRERGGREHRAHAIAAGTRKLSSAGEAVRPLQKPELNTQPHSQIEPLHVHV